MSGYRNSTRRRRCGLPQTTAGSHEEGSDQTLRRPEGLPWSRPPERRGFPTPDVGRQGFLGTGRRIGGIAGNWGGQRCRGNILGCVPEEGSAQPGSLLRAERRAKTSFGFPGAGGFRHDADRATCCRAWCLAFRAACSAVRRRSHDASFHSPIKRVQPWLDISQRGIVKPSREFFFLPATNKVTGGEEQNVSARVRRGRSW